ncbi:BTAD domain-containing putative transcriptional regulator [Streptomyces sp. NPDC091371]|uniref:AfsR/SARP family transcriptional regulator n=1 Tax=Streptomyces sp. NPDC091371 TaxID=3155303 RepID=UPI003437E547
MDIDVLGGLTLLEDGVPLAPTAPSELRVLAVLAAYADRVVPVAVLAGELGAGVPPERVHSVLERCARLFRERTALVRTPGGYLLDTAGGRLDAREFEREAAAGQCAMARGDHAAAARLLRGALRLWKGPAFDGVTPGPRLAGRIVELEAARKAVVEQWVEAHLALDRQREQGPGSAGQAGDGIPYAPGLVPPVRQFTPIGVEDSGWNRPRPLRTPARTAPPAAPGRSSARSAARPTRCIPAR